MTIRIEHGDMREVLARLIAEGVKVQSIVTDPPYHLTSIVKRFGGENAAPAKVGKTGAYARASTGFMGQKWDGGDIAFQPETWRLCWELLPPGGHLIAFSGTRTYHRMACAIEDAGFEIRDTIAWLYGSGFPKSHNVSKGIDKAAGAEREVVGQHTQGFRAEGSGIEGWQRAAHAIHGNITAPATYAARHWEGWGTALKPALEPICLARKPLDGTVAGNVLKHGTGALNIDGCRVATGDGYTENRVTQGINTAQTSYAPAVARRTFEPSSAGRWPANVAHDGSDEVVSAFPDAGGGYGVQGGKVTGDIYARPGRSDVGKIVGHGDSGSAARFFYSAKADKADRLLSKHPTVKPVDLMRWLIRMVTPPGGTVLDPFAGSGTTGMACMAEGIDCILVEREAEYVADIKRRLAHVRGDDTPLFAGAAE